MYQGNGGCVCVAEGGKDGDLDGARAATGGLARDTKRHLSMCQCVMLFV